MTATKEQERKALVQIREIVDGLGKDSYVAAAFDGCFGIAGSNIENDFMCSMKEKAEAAEQEAESFRKIANDRYNQIRTLREEIENLKGEAEKLTQENAYLDRLHTQLRSKLAQAEKRQISCELYADLCKIIAGLLEKEEKKITEAAEMVVQSRDGSELQHEAIKRMEKGLEKKWEFERVLGELDLIEPEETGERRDNRFGTNQ